MGHNTCKSMGRVLCVVRRQTGQSTKEGSEKIIMTIGERLRRS